MLPSSDEIVPVSRLTALLNVQGWSHLDAVLLAALATQSPALLIGPHGTAKTRLIECIAQALGLAFRHYNASLLNYDDLVGIPIPEEGHERLRFITTPGAIWDAEFVFFDEISRCRPDLQNKLFPIVHERRVVGMTLEALRHRWAAMNPPSPDSPDLDTASSQYYLGSEPLDPALTDRFPFVISVPAWRDLARDDQKRIILQGKTELEPENIAALNLPGLVEQCMALIPALQAEASEWLADYLLCVMELLDKAKLPQSPRRAATLAQNVIAIHAARMVLEGEDADLEMSAEMALLYGMPQTATEVPPAPATLVAIHKQAWEIATRLDDDAWRKVLEEADVLKRVVIAEGLNFGEEDMSRLITQALNVDASEARKIGLGTAIFLAFRKNRALTPAAWEPLGKLALRVLQPHQHEYNVAQNSPDVTLWNEMKPWVLKRRHEGELGQLEVNFILAGFPEMWRQYNWQDALTKFKDDLKLFGVREAD